MPKTVAKTLEHAQTRRVSTYIWHVVSVMQLCPALTWCTWKCRFHISLFSFCCIADNRGERSINSAEAAYVWLNPHHSTLRGGVPFFWLCILSLWISSRPAPHWHSDKLLTSGLVLVLDIASRRSNTESKYYYYFLSLGAKWSAESWLRRVFVHVYSRFSRRCKYICKGGKRTKNRKNEGRKKCGVWVVPEDQEWKTIIQTKQREMNYSSQGYIQLENECSCVICQGYIQLIQTTWTTVVTNDI